jgi:hypothetical protein
MRRKTSLSRMGTSRSKVPSDRILIEVRSMGLPSLAALSR